MTKHGLVKKEETNLTKVILEEGEKTYAREGSILASDVVIPFLQLIQPTSELALDRRATPGDMVRSVSGEKLGDQETPIEIIPLAPPKQDWVLEQKTGKRFEYRSVFARTAANENLPWYFLGNKDGQEVGPNSLGASEWRRVKRLSLFALLPKDIEAEAKEKEKALRGEMPDLSKALTPVMITFRGMSYNAGKEIVTFFTQAMSFKTDAWKYRILLQCEVETNDSGTYQVWKVDRSKPQVVAKEHHDIVKQWSQIVSTTAVKVDEKTEEGFEPSFDDRNL